VTTVPFTTLLDPRVVRTREAVLAAGRDVLVHEGWERVTVGVVADRSGFARTTLYRHWPHRLDLLRDLVAREAHLRHAVPSGDLRSGLVAEPEAFRAAISVDSLGEMVIADRQLARHDPELAELQADLRTAGNGVFTEILREAIRRGELSSSTDVDALIARLAGPVLYVHLLGQPDQRTSGIVAHVVDAVRAAIPSGPS
jgi:AcrR family transcriptional regulator